MAMKTGQRAVLYGIAALALAIGTILSGTILGFIPPGGSGFNPGSTSVLSIMLTDPPSVPEGVTAVYITYSSLKIHLTGLNDSGWVVTGAMGTLETMGLVNLSQTISTSSVPSGRYNLILFSISAARVTFEGSNYTATVNNGKLLVPILGGLELNSSKPGAAVIDIQPTVLKLGNQTDPRFVLTTGAKALQVPSGQVTFSMRRLGYTMPLAGHGWFRSFVRNHSGLVTAAGAVLTSNSFSFTLSDSTSDPVRVRMVVLSPPSSQGHRPQPSTLVNSVIFVFEHNGSIKPLSVNHSRGYTMGDVRSALASAGYQLGAGSSEGFSFSGSISTLLSRSGVVSGTPYLMTVIGDHALSSITVTAG